MQREVLWFKEVEKLVRPAFRRKKNRKGQTPHELFVAEHKGMRAEGEKFMKQTAKSCMMVTMLIATVVFTTAFTVPGGYNNSGVPILINERMFVVFPLSEAVATLSSLTSMLMFLSILTSRYSDEEFLRALLGRGVPTRPSALVEEHVGCEEMEHDGRGDGVEEEHDGCRDGSGVEEEHVGCEELEHDGRLDGVVEHDGRWDDTGVEEESGGCDEDPEHDGRWDGGGGCHEEKERGGGGWGGREEREQSGCGGLRVSTNSHPRQFYLNHS
ncbi:hypothetical protein SASPL_146386 [Salvia splendens]|uniref:PGG domain-containing protein n=1 Tax=Salvia splendens TaxID=180675 RepID=A0A8X8WBT2_SALSN|nr:hypothetical protein SASPL_146386 [Salvia splendens]